MPITAALVLAWCGVWRVILYSQHTTHHTEAHTVLYVMQAPKLTVTSYIIGEQSEEYAQDGMCGACLSECPSIAWYAQHECGLGTPPTGVVMVVRPFSTTNDVDDLDDLPF